MIVYCDIMIWFCIVKVFCSVVITLIWSVSDISRCYGLLVYYEISSHKSTTHYLWYKTEIFENITITYSIIVVGTYT